MKCFSLLLCLLITVYFVLTKITEQTTTRTRNFVTTVTFYNGLFTFRTTSHHSFCCRFFHTSSSICFFLFLDLITSQWYMSFLTTMTTGSKTTFNRWTLEHILGWRDFCCKTTFGAGAVFVCKCA